MDDEVWDTATRLSQWLDASDARPRETRLLLRVLKITEEAGEAAEALQGVLGTNPRKGHSHTEQEVASELCDVILTAMVALSTLTPEAEVLFRRHLRAVAERSLGEAYASGVPCPRSRSDATEHGV